MTCLLESSDKIFKTKHSEDSKGNINYLQSLGYRIDAKLLKVLENNLNLIPQYKEIKEEINDKTREEYCGPKPLSNSKGMKKNWYEKRKSYERFALGLKEIYYTIELLNLLQNQTIYFPINHDGRGRLYPLSYPVATTSTNYIRSLITSEKEYEFSKESNPKNWELFVDTLAERLDTLTIQNLSSPLSPLLSF